MMPERRQEANPELFDPRLVEVTAFTPHSYAELQERRAFPEGAVPEPAYRQMLAKLSLIDDVVLSRIVYVSDGLKVTGMMAAPRDAKPGSCPLVIYNRGGNREYGRLTVVNVLRNLAPLARKGYVVMASNYRGNDGGEGREEFGGADVNDVLTLLDIGRHHPLYDGKNAYMIGHSRGGMMTYLALKHGAKVNAAVAIAAISEQTDDFAERPDMEHIYRALVPEGEDFTEELRARSAVHWPEAITAPLLLLHGDKDESVRVHHSQKLADILKERGHKHRLVVYPRGTHALMRYWDEVLNETFAWLEAHRAEEQK